MNSCISEFRVYGFPEEEPNIYPEDILTKAGSIATFSCHASAPITWKPFLGFQVHQL